ncbi:hypothetical protein C349_03002 [Cryptococcus neoformans var. grubii Br795]|nr:hypothetical protein C349_03002 [Cryptococcus neoformans var. grubii Br795]
MAMSKQRKVLTLEHFIIDTFTRLGNDGIERPVEQPDQIGGGGTYAIIGARAFLPPTQLGMIVDYTPSTFPQALKDALESYGNEMWAFRERTDGLPTARAVNRYDGETRGFEYLYKPVLLSPNSLKGTHFEDIVPSVIHFISYPAPRAGIILDEINDFRISKGWSPLIVWEPEDESLEVVTSIASHVDILGPNQNEALRLYSLLTDPTFTDDDFKAVLTKICRSLAYLRPRIGAVIRAGHLGCCYASADPRGYRPEVKWVPAYWNKERDGYEGKVVDSTGAGNAFMGGIAAALSEGKSLDEAVRWGSVAASFAIEQNGLPQLTKTSDGPELWNGQNPQERLTALSM